MKIGLLVAILLSLAVPASFALSSPAGASRLESLSSPALMSLPSVGGASNSASVSTVNPAASGGAELPSTEVFFAGLANLTQPTAYLGSAFAAGGLLPTAYGVYAGSARFVTSSLPLQLGTFGSFNVSLAKRLYPKLLIGAGLGFSLGEGSRFDWGLGLNVGFVDLAGTVGVLRDFSWGAAVDGIGKPFTPFSGYASFPPSFTPALGAGFDLYKGKALTARLSGQVSFPSFQDVRFGLGGSLAVGGTSQLSVSTTLDLRDLLSASQQFPLSAGLVFSFALGGRSAFSRVQPSVAAEQIAPGVYAFGGGMAATIGRKSTLPPRIRTGAPQVSYISPNGDGVKDTLVVPFTVTDSAYIDGYRMTIRSRDGAVVRTINGPSSSIAARSTTGLLDRLLYVKGGVPVPKRLVWDGRNNNGAVVPDGSYTYSISVWDSNGNLSSTPTAEVIVDTKAPIVHLAQPPGSPPIFSPNGDGYKDTLSVRQTGSTEPLWTGRFINAAGEVVRTISWHDSAPQSFVWDGRGNGGRVLPDGVYHYVVSATDHAGNSARASIPAIIIDNARPSVRVDVTVDAISPGTSSPQQSVRYDFLVPDKNYLESWNLVIVNKNGTPVRTAHGGSAMPPSYTFDGTDQTGRRLPDGPYQAELSVVYRNGSHSRAQAATVTIDRTAPTASVKEEYHVFSPVGTGDRTTMVFDMHASVEPMWNGVIATGAGALVKRYEWHGVPPATVSWDGRSASGTLEPDGIYQFSISATDNAGNFGQSNVVSFVLDTQHKQLLLSTNYDAFSPNGARNVIHINPTVRSPKGLQSYRIAIENRSGTVVGSFQGSGVPTGPFAWNGLLRGGPVAAGEYRAVMIGSYANGATATAETAWFSVVTSRPTVEVSSTYRVFSPNGDGHRDTVSFQQRGTHGTVWTGQILSSDGRTVLEKHWRGALPPSFTWNGTDTLGNRVANGSYSYVLSTVDRAGNVAQATITGIVVDDSPTQVYIDAEAAGFSPNGDGILDTIGFRTVETPASGISAWKVEVLAANGGAVRTWSGRNAPPTSPLVWNGSTGAAMAPDGHYTARLTVHYRKGDVDTAVTAPFLLVARPPSVSAEVSPLPFAPGGVQHTATAGNLNFRISVSSLDRIARWKIEIYSPAPEEPFQRLAGEGPPPAVVSWNGRGSDGTSVVPWSVYSYHLTVVDSLGNSTLLTGNIPIASSSTPPVLH